MINKIILSLIYLVFGVTLVNASEEVDFSLKRQDGLSIGVQAYWYKYEEEVDDSFFMSNEGEKYGVSASYAVVFDENYLLVEGRYATGDVEYKSASGTGDVSDDVYEVRLIGGIEREIDTYLLGSYIGIGYRFLENDLRDLGAGGYRRESQYLYIPIGITNRFHIGKDARISTSIEYDILIWAEQKSYLSDVSAAYGALYGDPVNEQKSGYGIRLSTAYELVDWSIGLFFNYWDIDDSEKNTYTDGITTYTLYEPKNDTKEIGIEIKYKF